MCHIEIFNTIISCIGLLEPPSNVSVEYRNETRIHVIWQPPSSLKEITGYAVTILWTKYGNETREELQSVLPELSYSWRPDHGYCSKLTFKVAAINVVGTGNRSSGIVTAFLRYKLACVEVFF